MLVHTSYSLIYRDIFPTDLYGGDEWPVDVSIDTCGKYEVESICLERPSGHKL